MGVFVKTAEDGWLNLETGAEKTPEGLADWATITSASIAGYEYADAEGFEWISFEFTSDGCFTLEGDGLVELLLVASAGQKSGGSAGGKGGGVLVGIQEMPAGTQEVVVGNGGSVSSEPTYITEADGTISWIGVVGDWSNPPNTGNGGMDLSGNGVNSRLKDGTQIGYGGGSAATADYGQGNPPRANSGGASTNTDSVQFGADGVCIVRVPKGNAIDATVAPCTTSIRSKAHEAIVKKASE